MLGGVQKCFYAPNFQKAAHDHVKKCLIWLKNNAQGGIRTRQGSFPEPTSPFQVLSMDYIELDKCQNKRFCLVIIWHYSNWTEIHPTAHADADFTVKVLKESIFYRFKKPEIIYPDNGTVKQQLIKAMETTGKPWPDCLHLVKTSIYTTACGKHKLTPFECIFHRT